MFSKIIEIFFNSHFQSQCYGALGCRLKPKFINTWDLYIKQHNTLLLFDSICDRISYWVEYLQGDESFIVCEVSTSLLISYVINLCKKIYSISVIQIDCCVVVWEKASHVFLPYSFKLHIIRIILFWFLFLSEANKENQDNYHKIIWCSKLVLEFFTDCTTKKWT